MPPDLTIVIPTLNERDNIRPLLAALGKTLRGINWEAMFVDDNSSDGTRDEIEAAAKEGAPARLIHRRTESGLASACITGMNATFAPYIAVMDADLQHDETLLPHMFDALRKDHADIVVGSRYMEGGGVGDWDKSRSRLSMLGTRLARLILRQPISDPMSGFFMLKRSLANAAMDKLSGKGFKILFDLLAAAPTDTRILELPFTFRDRHAGESKLDTTVLWEFGLVAARRAVGRVLPERFLLFTLVGLSGVVVQLAVLELMLEAAGLRFVSAQAIAVIIAMTSNYVLNNVFTFRDRRLKGLAFIRGLASFYVACGIGALTNYALALFLFDQAGFPEWLASAAGAVVAAVWNFATTSTFTWTKR